MSNQAESSAVETALSAVLRHGFDRSARFPDEPLSDGDFDRMVEIAMGHGLLGAVAQAAADGDLQLSPDQFGRLADHHAGSMAHMLLLERMILAVSDALDRAGVEMRVLKGLALAHIVHGDPAWRTAADVDVLVRSEQLSTAVAIIIDELGGELPVPELRPGFDREFGKESMLRVGAVEIDLHRTFVTGPFGLTIRLDELFEDGSEFAIANHPLVALGSQHMFLHACYNVALGDYPVRLGPVRDLLLCSERLDVDFDEAVATARRWRATAVIQRAAQIVLDTVGDEAGGPFTTLCATPVPRREAWLLRSYLTEARSYTRPLASLVVIRGLAPRVRYARSIVAPSATYLSSRGWTLRGHARRALSRFAHHG